jgi:hypothetical protein
MYYRSIKFRIVQLYRSIGIDLVLTLHWPIVELELRETHWGGKQDDDDDDDDGLLLSL